MPRPVLFARSCPSFLLLGLLIACGSGGDVTAPSDPPAGGILPAELLGEWHYEFIGDLNCDTETGHCVSTSNHSETVTLTSSGHFEHVYVAESNFPPCSTEVLHQSEGTAEAQGSTLLLHMTTGKTRVTNTCGENSTSDEAGNTYTYTWDLDTSSGAPQLTLTNDHDVKLGPFEKKP